MEKIKETDNFFYSVADLYLINPELAKTKANANTLNTIKFIVQSKTGMDGEIYYQFDKLYNVSGRFGEENQGNED